MSDEVIEQLTELAMQSEMVEDIDWENINVNQRDIFRHMAKNVYEQLSNLEENERSVVAMATMTKLLVENFVYKMLLGKSQ